MPTTPRKLDIFRRKYRLSTQHQCALVYAYSAQIKVPKHSIFFGCAEKDRIKISL